MSTLILLLLPMTGADGEMGAALFRVRGVFHALSPGIGTGLLFAAIGIIHAVARRRGHLLAQDLLLAGVVANSFFLAALAVLQYLARPHQAAQILHWTLGAIRVGEQYSAGTTYGVLQRRRKERTLAIDSFLGFLGHGFTGDGNGVAGR